MAISNTLKGFLDGAKVRYTVAKHPVAYTAQEIAAAQHVPGRQLAKCVLVLTEHGPALAVLSAVYLIDLKKLRAALGAKKLSIGRESDIKRHFPDVEVGAMAPFGNLYGVPVIADRGLQDAQEIVFNAGSHTETIKMRYADFASLVKPKTGAFALPLPKPARPRRKKPVKAAKKKAPARRPAARTRRKR